MSHVRGAAHHRGTASGATSIGAGAGPLLASAACHRDIHSFEGAWGEALPPVWEHEAAGIDETVADGVDDIELVTTW